jgi:FAD synthase
VLERLRLTRRFDGLDDLLGQIRLDIERARSVCSQGW